MPNKVTKTFLWRTRNKEMLHPSVMETNHIFFTIRMIWNHSAPEQYRIEPYQRYDFGSFYTNEYIKEAIPILATELCKRGKLSPYFTRCLNYMYAHYQDIYGQSAGAKPKCLTQKTATSQPSPRS